MVRVISIVILVTFVCLQVVLSENKSVEIQGPYKEDHNYPGIEIEEIQDGMHKRFARQATTRKVTTKRTGTSKKGTTKRGTTKKANKVFLYNLYLIFSRTKFNYILINFIRLQQRSLQQPKKGLRRERPPRRNRQLSTLQLGSLIYMTLNTTIHRLYVPVVLMLALRPMAMIMKKLKQQPPMLRTIRILQMTL